MGDILKDDPMYTTKLAAPQIHQEADTLRKWRIRGKGPVYLKLGGKVYYKKSDLLAFIEQSRVIPNTKRKNRRRKRAA